MGKNVILSTILVFLIIATISDASLLSNFRKLAASSPKEDHHNASVHGSPIPSPTLLGKQSGMVDGEEKDMKKKNQPPPPSSPPLDANSEDKKMSNNTNTPSPPPSPLTDANEHKSTTTHKENVKEKEKEKKESEKEKDSEKEEEKEKKEEKAEEKEEQKEEQKEKEERKAEMPAGSDDSCDGKGRCEVLKSLTACIKSFDHDSKVLVLLIQNKGDSNLKVEITTSSRNQHKVINIRKRHDKQVNVSLADSVNNEVTLNAGNGHCVLHLGIPVSQGSFFQQFPSYTKFMTPVYGAYLVLAITLIAGGVFACCCWFRKRKGQRDNPYQELEMSVPESAVAVESAEGWDEVWDDDWDEENAVRSPGGHNISVNGLTSRNPKKDDWEDWDD